MPTQSKVLKNLAHFVLELPKRSQKSSLGILDKNGNLKHISSLDYYKHIVRVTNALGKLGLSKGDKIAIFSNTRYEWSVADLAASCLGAVVVPLYPNMATDELSYILNHSECKMIFVENRTSLRQLLVIKDKCPQLKNIVVFDPPQQHEMGTWQSLEDFQSSVPLDENSFSQFNELCSLTSSSDAATIIYTSGTTGVPKGVVLGHSQIINEVIEAFAALQITADDKTLSFLPYSHVLGRTEHWGHLIIGYSMVYSAGAERLPEELQQIEPTVIVAVPRIFEKIYTSLKTKIDTSSIDKAIFSWAHSIGDMVSKKEQAKAPLDLKLKSQQLLADVVLFRRLKEQLFGKKLRFAVSGGAPLSLDILKFFHSCGILILEGYGLTETTGAICVNRPYDFEFGSVGKPLNKTTIKISSDGEILVKGPTVLKAYFKDDVATHTLNKEGWLHTGDIGELSPSGRLVIKDRKKDLIKTANGKYIAPQKLEGMLKQLPFISHVHIHGDQRKYIVALLTLNKNYLFADAREKGIDFKSLEDLKEHQAVKEMIRDGIAGINSNLSAHETIKNYAVLSEDFSVESGEITPSLKVKRRVIDQKYKTLIDSLYVY